MRVRLLVLVTAAFVLLVGAADPLRPLVIRTEQPRGGVPTDCDEGLSPTPALRVDVREIPLPEIAPAAAVAPPSGALRDALEDVQTALVRNDRPAFDAALARARGIVETYPTGGERRAAEETLRIYEGAARLWEAQYQSPFFAQDSPEYAIVSEYPGYAEAVRRSTLTDQAGRRFYPAAESREFLARVAADRLKRLGVRATTPPTRTASASVSPAPPTRTQRRVTSSSPSKSRPRITTSRKTRKPAATKSAPSTPNPSAPPTVAAVPAPAAPNTAPPAAGDASDVAPPPAVADTPPAPATDTVAPTPVTTATATDAPTPATTTTAEPATAPAEPAARSRSIVLPTILILIGLGVLIVLFRASK